jgi:oxygen-independent coproporphyrinogen-3 oxidase
MELPFNTVYSKDILGNQTEVAVADWATKRAWVNYAFDVFLEHGYHVSSAYTVVKDPEKVNFSYRDNLWTGADLLATGIASFGHVSSVHYQNRPEWQDYVDTLLNEGRLPLGRALKPTARQLLIREMILQLKRGYLDAGYFRDKFEIEILREWQDEWQAHQEQGMLTLEGDRVTLTRQGILQADALLPPFFEEQHQGVRYT